MIKYIANLIKSRKACQAAKLEQARSFIRILNDGSDVSVSRMFSSSGVRIRGYQDFSANHNPPHWLKTKYQHPLEAYYSNR